MAKLFHQRCTFILIFVTFIGVFCLFLTQKIDSFTNILLFQYNSTVSFHIFPSSSSLSSSSSSSQLKITPIIHQSWKNQQLPTRFALWSKSWKNCFPTWTYTMWTDEDNRHFIKQHYSWMLNYYDNLPQAIQRADAVRYLYLYHFGGLYADLDAECLSPFDHLLSNYSIVFSAYKAGWSNAILPEGRVENSFMYSKPRHSFWLRVIEDMMHRSGADPLKTTGPILLEENIRKYRVKYNNEIMIYPPAYFNPYNTYGKHAGTPAECKLKNQMNDKDLQICRDFYLKNGSFVLQYHTMTWYGGKVL